MIRSKVYPSEMFLYAYPFTLYYGIWRYPLYTSYHQNHDHEGKIISYHNRLKGYSLRMPHVMWFPTIAPFLSWDDLAILFIQKRV